MSPGGVNRSSDASNRATGPVTAAASSSSDARSLEREASVEAASQVRIDSDSSQSPEMFFKNRTRPSTPPSLVKFASRAASVTIGDGSSRPTSDQVPLEI